ncbi:hypothetical protein GCM10011274_15890 [Paraglaciecola chathamensis]|uniref:Uncharacterized protein n=1 Tax=Paraglaciecola chathamensis TaxID=368405 RepID=A0A8H9LVZ7_9ALTE|nr:hypothetical protein GCM10011274_15890 [Paraglaciecola oceanifecundans]
MYYGIVKYELNEIYAADYIRLFAIKGPRIAVDFDFNHSQRKDKCKPNDNILYKTYS